MLLLPFCLVVLWRRTPARITITGAVAAALIASWLFVLSQRQALVHYSAGLWDLSGGVEDPTYAFWWTSPLSAAIVFLLAGAGAAIAAGWHRRLFALLVLASPLIALRFE